MNTLSDTNVVAPYHTNIPDGLNMGAQIIVRGRIPYGEEGFYINLQNKQEDGCDIAFHLNIKTSDQSVIRKAYEDGEWQDEEKDIPFFPFSQGSKFTIHIIQAGRVFQVLVNNRHFIEFVNRLNYRLVNCLMLSRGAEYYEATVRNRRSYYDGYLYGNLKVNMAVRIRGVVSNNAKRFDIMFNSSGYDQVGFQLSARLDQNDIALNTKKEDWGVEERVVTWFPFQGGQFFEAFFLVCTECYKVNGTVPTSSVGGNTETNRLGKNNIFVNGRYLTSYSYRVPLEDIKRIRGSGEVTEMDIDFANPLANDSVKPIPSGLEKQELISIKGIFHPEGNRFFVNLLYGLSPDDDVALHFNPRRDQDEVVLNSRYGGDWEEEERHPLPAAMKEIVPFTVEIANEEDRFKLYVNGRNLGNFRCRGNVEDIKGIHFEGDVYIYGIKLLRRLDTSIITKLPHDRQWRWLSLMGIPKEGANQFTIDMQTGDCPDRNVALHLNVRFEEKICIRNSLLCGYWGDEEIEQPHFPFEIKDKFEINILATFNCYKVFVNGQHYIDYTYRIAPEAVTHLMLAGDVDFFEPDTY